MEVKNQKEFKLYRLADLMEKSPKENPYIIEGMVPEEAITSITADSGKGKSLLALIMTYHIAAGEPLFGLFKVKQSRVIIVDLEMDEDIIITRVKSIFNRNELPVFYHYGTAWQIDNDNDYEALEKVIIENGIQVVIFDTLSSIHSKRENESSEMREINALFLRLIQETGVTIIYLHHHRKSQKGENFSQSSSRGSTEIIAKAASHLLIDSQKWINEDGISINSLIVQQEKSRRPDGIKAFRVDVRYLAENNKTYWEFKGSIEEDKRSEAKKRIMEILQDRMAHTIKDFTINIKDVCEKYIRWSLKDLERDHQITSYKHGGNVMFYILNNTT